MGLPLARGPRRPRRAAAVLRLADLDLPAEVGDDVRERAGLRGVRAALEQRADQPALGGLVEVADHLAPRRRPGAAPGPWPPGAPARRRAARTRRTSWSAGRRPARRPAASRTAGSSALAPDAGDGAEPGQVDPAGEAVRRDPVARPHQPEHRRRHREPRRGARRSGGRVEGREVERLVEHPGVDAVGAGGRRGEQIRRCGVRSRPGWGRGRATAAPAPGRPGTARPARRAPVRGRR